MRVVANLVILLLLSSLISGCFSGDDSPPLFEGDEPGECSDGADNDQDGLFDCDDPNCAGAGVCVKPTSDDDNSNPQNETNNDDIILGPIELTNEMIDNGVLDNNDCAVVIITTDWDAPSRQLMAQLTDFNKNNSIFELYVANLQNEQGDDILPTFEQFRGGVLMPESIPSIAIISFEEQIMTAWTGIQEAILVDIVCTLEQRDSISEAFTFEDLSPTSEDFYYTRITSVTITPENPHSHENPICSAQWESNEHDDGDLTVMYSWGLIWNESAALESGGIDPDTVWFSDFSESGIFDRNDTDWRNNPDTGEPFTNIEIANQSISGKELMCSAYLLTGVLASAISEVDYEDLVEGVLVWDNAEPVRFQSEGTGDDCEGALDCAGVCNGDSIHDECGVCGGDGSSCGGTDPADPEGGCGNITYTGCCNTDEDGNYTIVTWCDDEVIDTLNCGEGGNPGCGWDASAGYYNCVEAPYVGTEDPSGENPCDCSELESEES